MNVCGVNQFFELKKRITRPIIVGIGISYAHVVMNEIIEYNMKTVVFGDIHGRSVWKEIVTENFDADRFIFLGDYFTSREGISEEEQIKNFQEIVEFARKQNNATTHRDKVVLLRGNHDMEACKYPWADCRPSFRSKWVYENRDFFLENTQWVFVDDLYPIIYAHAGITKTWMERNELTNPEEINELEPSKIFGFTSCRFSDYCGDSVTQPPTWIRPWGLIGDSFGNYTYVVGHTTMEKITNVKVETLAQYESDYGDNVDEETINEIKSANDIWVCDTLPREYLTIINGKFEVCKYSE